MSKTTASVIASLFTANVGRIVLSAGKDGAEDVRYKVAKLSDKLGSMKDGTKAEYVVLQREDDTAVVINLHPNAAKKLLTKGEEAGLKLLPTEGDAEPAEELSAEEQEAAKAELEAEQAEKNAQDAGEPAAEEGGEAEAAAEPKEPTKKERTIEMFKAMQADGKGRKDIIAKMKSELGLSAAGANTYYQNCKSGLWS